MAEHLLHPGLLAHVPRGVLVHARYAECSPGLRQRHLELLQDADEPLDLPDLGGQPPDRVDQLLRVERVGDLPVPGDRLAQLRRHLVG